jgi:hypothetical protein
MSDNLCFLIVGFNPATRWVIFYIHVHSTIMYEINKHYIKPKGQPRMDNLEIHMQHREQDTEGVCVHV